MGNSSSKKEKEKAKAAAFSSNSQRGSVITTNGGAAAASSSSSSAAGTSSSKPDALDIKDQLVLLDEPVYVVTSEPEFQPTDPVGSPVHQVETQAAAVSFWSKEKTFRPQRVIPESAGGGKGGRLLRTVEGTMKATLGVKDLEEAVKCPPGEDRNEWLAVNTCLFVNAVTLIYGTAQQYCTPHTCPIMGAGKCEYLWKDDDKYPKPTRLPAPVYIDFAMSEIDAQITDTSIFPVSDDDRFPRNFLTVCKLIYKRLFRVYAHIYCAHHDKIRAIGASAHLNTCFKHFVYFVREFSLIDKGEMAPLQKLIDRFTTDGDTPVAAHHKH